MNTVLIVVSIILLPVIGFIVYRLFAFRKESMRHNKEQFEKIEPLYNKLKNNEPIDELFILPFATNPETRGVTYRWLEEHNKTNLFPKEYYSIEHGAESEMVNWLLFPTELGSIPDEIEHAKKVIIDFDGNNVIYHVFKFRMNPPHWAAEIGWSLGVAGPYFDDSEPYDNSNAFSRIGKMDLTTPEAEVEWVHKNVSMRLNPLPTSP
jgi:hypothetical protein